MNKEEIQALVAEIRVAKSDNEYQVDFDATRKKIEEKENITIIVETPNKEAMEFKDILFFSQNSGSVQKQEEGKKFLIRISPFDYSRRQKFTEAHEYGHIALKHEFPNDGDIIVEPKDNIKARSYNPNDKEEVEANRFAAELLMPQNLIEKFFPEKIIILSDIEKGADEFGVSKSAMMVRLDSLGYSF